MASLTKLQLETLALVRDGKVSQRNHGHGAWRIVGANPSVVGRLTSLGLVRWTKVIGGDAELTTAGCDALPASGGDHGDHQVVFAALEAPRITGEQPTGRLRWCGDKLQQEWLITEYAGSSPVSRRTEWRDIPTDDTDAGFPTAITGGGDGAYSEAIDTEPEYYVETFDAKGNLIEPALARATKGQADE
ncbi:hypothetical protein [Shinella sp.]|uniref:hypothetical protein n=1 Tax=Shinella sp. TaxID=1870904 RepID=UPI002582E2A8|nr:hypothetical protein [Shinella sp.]MCW5711290.1 hypothetical protein [Shinella sp.]